MEYLVTFVMQKPFVSQPELFVTTSDLDHPALHALDNTEAVLDWTKFEPILSTIYASKTGRPSYPLLTLFRGLLLGVWYRLLDVQLSQCLRSSAGRSRGASAMSALRLSVFAHKNGLNAPPLFIDILSKQNSSPHPL